MPCKMATASVIRPIARSSVGGEFRCTAKKSKVSKKVTMAKSNGMRMNENCRASRRRASIRLVATPASSSGAGSLTASRNASRMAGSISCPCGDGVGLGFRGSGIPALPPSQRECDRENSLCSEMPDIAGISCSLLRALCFSFALLCYTVSESACWPGLRLTPQEPQPPLRVPQSHAPPPSLLLPQVQELFPQAQPPLPFLTLQALQPFIFVPPSVS